MLDVPAAPTFGICRAAGLRINVSSGGETQAHERHPASVISLFALKEQFYAQL
jgi:hypothetical protein